MLPVDASASRHISSTKVSYETHVQNSKPLNIPQIQADHQKRSAEMLNIQNQLQNIKDGDKNYLKLLHDYKELLELESNDHAQVDEHLQNNKGSTETEKQQLKSLLADMKKTINGDNDGVADKMHDLGKGRKLANVPDDKTSVFKLAQSVFGKHTDDSRTLNLNRDAFDSNSLGAAYAQRGLRDIDVVHKNDMVVIASDQQKRSSTLPTSLEPKPADVPSDLKNLTTHPTFPNLKPNQQQVAIKAYQDVLGSKNLLTPDELKTVNENLPALVSSDAFQKLDPGMRSAALGLFKDVAVKTNNADQTLDIKNIQKIISEPSFAELQPASAKIDTMNLYVRDANFRGEVDKLLGEGWVRSDDKALAMSTMARVTHSLLYEEADTSHRALLLDNAHALGTHNEFRMFTATQRDAAIARLTEHRNGAQKFFASAFNVLGDLDTKGWKEGQTELGFTNKGMGKALEAGRETPAGDSTPAQPSNLNLQSSPNAQSKGPESKSNLIDTTYMTPAQAKLYTQNRMLFIQTFLEADVPVELQQQFFQSLSDPDAAVMQELCDRDEVVDCLYDGGTYKPEVAGILKNLMEGTPSSDSGYLWKREILGS